MRVPEGRLDDVLLIESLFGVNVNTTRIGTAKAHNDAARTAGLGI